jgi:hypothetical protein
MAISVDKSNTEKIALLLRTESTTANTGLAKVAVQFSADTFVVNQSLVLRINICGKNRHLRQARKRYMRLPLSITNALRMQCVGLSSRRGSVPPFKSTRAQ